MSILVLILLFYTVIEHSIMVSARGCPGSTCISPVWLERCKLLILQPGLIKVAASGLHGEIDGGGPTCAAV